MFFFLDLEIVVSFLKMSNYTEECLKNFVKVKASYQVQIKFEIYPSEIQVYFYYNDENYFNVNQSIKDLYNYLLMLKLGSTIQLDLTIAKFALSVTLNI